MSFYSGLLRGIHRGAILSREEAARRQVEQDARDEKILTHLATADDPEIADTALLGLMHLATGEGRKPKNFLSNLMGAPVAESPHLRSLMKMVREPVQVAEGLPVSEFGGVETGPMTTPPASQQQPSGTSAAMAPPPGQPGSIGRGAPTGPPPVDASLAGMPQPRGGVGPRTDAATDVRVAAMTPMMPPPLAFRGIKLGRDIGRTAPTTMARRIFLSPDEKIRRSTLAKASADVEGEVAGLIAAGFTPVDARALIKEKYERNARGGQGALGTVQQTAGEIPMPDGTFRSYFATFDRVNGSPTFGQYIDPITKKPIPGFRPRTTTGSTSLGADREALARAFFGGRSYSQLTPAEQRQVIEQELHFNREEAFQRGTGSGQASINTELDKPIGINLGAEQGVSPTATLRDFRGIIPITDEQRNRLTAATSLATDIAEIDRLVRSVFPLGWGPIPTKAAILYKSVTADVDFASLRSKIQLAIGNVAKVLAAESGRLTQQDIERAQVALTNLDAGLLEGETQETALAKVQQILTGLNRVLADIKTPSQQMQERGTTVGGSAGAAGAPPSLLDSNVLSALAAAKVAPGQKYVIIDIKMPDGTTQVWSKDLTGRLIQIK